MNTRRKRKFKMATRSESEIALFTTHFQQEVCFVGSLNLWLKLPKQMQKTKDESDNSRLR